MQKIRTLVGVALTLAAFTACSNPPVITGTDSGLPATDGGGTDTGRDGGGSSGGTCAMPINLNTAGMPLATGTGRMITGDNSTAPAGQMTGLANGTCAVDNGGAATATNEVVYQYTVQTGGHLSATTEGPQTIADLDTIVWILDGCSAAANELACNDDIDMNTLTSNAVADATVTAGTTVFIVVAGYDGATPAAGTYSLIVTELQPHATGAVCDQSNPYCVDGSTCLLDSATATTGHCLANGADNGLCRLAAPYCDTGLGCSELVPEMGNEGICQVPIAAGAVCSDTHYVCVTGNTCQLDDGSTTAGHCLADGAEYGACRITGAACDATLTCSNATPTAANRGTCQMPIAAAGVCTLRHSLCVVGNTCQLDDGSDTMGHCLANGAEYGECRTTAPFCDGTLMCGNPAPTTADPGTCQMPIATGGACSARHYLCVANDTCILDAGSMTMGHCLADGAMGGACRMTTPECDGALMCDADGLCN